MNSQEILLLCTFFALGSIPFAILVGLIFFQTDVRNQGSGNPGATNVARILGKKAGLSVLFLDAAKGFTPVLYWSLHVDYTSSILAGFAAVLGHCFSPFLKGKGGKGVATLLGISLAFDWLLALSSIAAFVLTTLLTKIVALGSLIAIFTFFILGIFIFGHQEIYFMIFGFSSMLLTLYTHRKNLQRILDGSENKI